MKKEEIIEILRHNIARISKQTKQDWDAFCEKPHLFVKTLRLQGKSMDIQNIVEQAIASDEKCQYIRINAQDIANYVNDYNRDFDIIPHKEQMARYLNQCWQNSVLSHCPFLTSCANTHTEEYKACDKQLGYGILLIENIDKVHTPNQYYYHAIYSIAKSRQLYDGILGGAWKVILGFEGDYGDSEGLAQYTEYLSVDKELA